MPDSPRARWVSGAAVAALMASLVAFWPGVVTYDGVTQFAQARAGRYEDWHPPVMAWLWHGLHGVFGGAAQPMLTLQMVLYWAGFGLIAGALARSGRPRAAWAVLAIGASPLFLGWQAVVLKDTQMLGAMLAACGLVVWWRVRGARVPLWAGAGVVVLLTYATLVRANAVFATVPLAVMLAAPPHGRRRMGVIGALIALGVAAVLAVSPIVNHRLLGAAASGVERTQAVYDLAAIAVRAPDAAIGFSPAEARRLRALHCVKPLFWDPLGEPTRCGPITARVQAMPAASLYPLLLKAALHSPAAYAAHRLAHLNATQRWLVPLGWPGAAPPARSEPNPLGLGSPGAVARAWQGAARWVAETPLGWPFAWLVLAVAGVAVGRSRPANPLRDVALALALSAVTLEASFVVLSIASDLRYHLWPMVAAALAMVLSWADRRWSTRSILATAAALALVSGPAMLARATLTPPPQGYHDLLL